MESKSQPRELRGIKGFDLIAGLVLLAISLLIYGPSFKVPFQLDDLGSIADNHYIRISDLRGESLWKAGFQDGKHNRPLTNLSLALNFYFNQLNPFGYHLINFLFFLATAFGIRLVLFGLLKRRGYNFFRSWLASWFLALIWTTHPLNIEAVTYIVQRHSSFAASFSVWAIYFFQLGKDKNHRLYFYLCALFCGLAMLSKETALVLPLLIFLYNLYFYQDLNKGGLKRNQKWILGLAMIYLGAGILLFRPGMVEKLTADLSHQALSPGQKLFLEPEVLLWYALIIVFPFPQFLSLMHPFSFPHTGFALGLALSSWGVVILIGFFGLTKARKRRIFSFAVLWYFLQLAVEAMPLPIELASEHRLYLALLSIWAPLIAFPILRARRIGLVLGWILLIAGFFGWFTFNRNLVWKSRTGLWRDTVKKAPHNKLSRYSLGFWLEKEGRAQEAERVFRWAITEDPGDVNSWYHLANVLYQQNRLEEAIQAQKQALRLAPKKKGMHNNLGFLLEMKGEFGSALKEYHYELDLYPGSVLTLNNLGKLYLKLGQCEQANQVREALGLNADAEFAQNWKGRCGNQK